MSPKIKFSNQPDLEISSNGEQNQKHFCKKTNYSVIEIQTSKQTIFSFCQPGEFEGLPHH